MNKLIAKIFEEIKRHPENIRAYNDLFDLCRNIEKDNFDLSHKTNKELRLHVSRGMKKAVKMGDFFDLYKRTLLFDTKEIISLSLSNLENQVFSGFLFLCKICGVRLKFSVI